MFIRLKRGIATLICAFLLSCTHPVFAAESSTKSADSDSAPVIEEMVDLGDGVQDEIDKQEEDGRGKIIAEAESALTDTEEALKALEEERIDDALAKLASATGKLELVVARDPELALAPIDVSITHRDIYASLDDIEAVIEKSKIALIRGDVQEARRLLKGMGSELITTVSSLPLASYPDAIKAVTPLIDEGKVDLAKTQLENALQTVVLTDYMTPLPEIRSNAMIERAEELAEMSARTPEEETELKEMLNGVREELELAQLLGYGKRDDYKGLYQQLEVIKGKTQEGDSGEGFFDSIKKSLSSMWASVTS